MSDDQPHTWPVGLPKGLHPYRRTPEFDQDSLPAALRHQHSTKAGAWGVINVLEGALLYRKFDPDSEAVLTPQTPGVIRPQQLHEVEPVGRMRMFVQFYSAPETADEPAVPA